MKFFLHALHFYPRWTHLLLLLGLSSLPHLVGAQTYTASGLPQAIEDGGSFICWECPGAPLVSTLNVPLNLTITDARQIRISMNLAHPAAGELKVQLRTPNGVVINLMDRMNSTVMNPCGDTRAFNGNHTLTFTAQASFPLNDPRFATGCLPTVSDLGVTGNLNSLVGIQTNGNWQLSLVDGTLGNVGNLLSWSIGVVEMPSVTINASNTVVCAGTSVTFTATTRNGGRYLSYQWQKNGINVGSNSPTYTDATLVNADIITCVLTSDDPRAFLTTATSLPIAMTVTALPTVNAVANQLISVGRLISTIPFTGTATAFTWANNNPAIGLTTNGTGDITAFTATNPTNAPITATITVTPTNIATPGFAYIPNIGPGALSSANPDSNPNGVSNNIASVESTISVINTTTNAIVADIPISGVLIGASVSPDGKRLYVTNWNSNAIEVISTQTRSVITTIAVGNNPVGVAVSPNNERVYVTTPSNVSVIDALTNTVVASIVGGGEGICVSPEGSRVYVARLTANHVTVINAVTNTIISTIAVGGSPSGICISPNGDYLYVTNLADGTVSVIKTLTNRRIATIPVGSEPKGIAFSPKGNFVYVSNYASSTVSVINTATNTVVNTITVGTNPWGLSVTPDGNAVYVANNGSNNISVIRTATNAVVSTITADGSTAFGNFITAAQAGCAGTPTSFSITVNPMPSLRITASPSNVIGEGTRVTFSATLTSGTGDFYVWSKNGAETYWGTFGRFDSTYTGATLRTNDVITCQVVRYDYDIEDYVTIATSNPITMTVVPLSTVSIHISAGSAAICAGTAVSFSATSANAGASPSYQWKKNGLNVGSNSTTYTDITLAHLDSITCWVTGTNLFGGVTAKSTPIIMTVLTPSVHAIADQTICTGQQANTISLSGSDATTFTWTNSNPNIGLAANGTGDIPAFTTLNNTNAATTATITVTPSQSNVFEYAYIPNYDANTVSVLNTALNRIVATIPVGIKPFGVAVSPNGERVYITNQGSNNVSVINTATHFVIATIPVGFNPFGVAVSADNHRVYVSNEVSGSVTVINAGTNTVVASIPAPAARGIAVNSAANQVYVTHDVMETAGSYMSVIDMTTNTLLRTLLLDIRRAGPYGVVVNPNGNRIYVTNYILNLVYVLEATTLTVLESISVGMNPGAMALSANGLRLYVSNRNSNSVSVIRTSSNQVIATIPAGVTPVGISVSADGNYIYVTNEISDSLSVLSTATNSVVSTMRTGTRPIGLGNFVQTTPLVCTGAPATFSVMVNPLLTPSVTVAAVPSNVITRGTSVTFTATPTNGGTSSFQWKKNNTNVGTNSATYTDANLAMNDVITCELTSNADCLSQNTAISEAISMVVTVTPEVNIAITTGSQTICAGTSVTFTATPINGGTSPSYQWKKNGLNVGTNNPTYTDATLATNDGITCELTSNDPNASPTTVVSNRVPMIVSPLPTIAPLVNQTLCAGNSTTALAFTGTNATDYTWTNSHPNIGLAATGTGDIAAFLATNNTQTPTTATITVTPTHNGRIGYAYIADYANSSISALNTATNTVAATIGVGVNPENIAVSPDGSRVYVVNSRAHTVSVISTATHTVLATVTVANYSYGIGISPDGSRVYVTSELARISVINTSTYAVSTIMVGNWPYGVVLSPDGNKIYVTDRNSSSIYRIDAATNAVTPINTYTRGYHICIRPDGRFIYAVAPSGFVLAVNTQTNAVTRIPIGSNPVGITANPNGRYIYVANSSSNNVSVISTDTHTEVATIAVGTSPQGVSVSSDGNYLYVTNRNSNSVSVIDVATHTVVTTLQNLNNRPSSVGNFVTATQIGCAGVPTTVTLTVNPLPTATITPSSETTFCQGGNVVLNANTGAGLNYQWKKDGNAIAANANAAAFTTSTSGSYTMVVTDANACRSTSNATSVTVHPLPTATIDYVTPTTFCQGGNVVLNANAGAGLTYQWRRNGIALNPTDRSYVATTSGDYSVIVTNANHCSVTSAVTSVIVRPMPIPVLNATGNRMFCQGDSVQLQVTGGVSYQWSHGMTDSSIWLNQTGLYTVTVTNQWGCSTPITQQIVVKPLPIATASAGGATTFCQGGQVVLNANTGAGLTYQWRNNGTPISGATNANYTANATGLYTVIVTGLNACSNTSIPNSVIVNALPIATISNNTPTTFCQNGNVVLNANLGNGLSYQWNQNGNAIAANANGATFTATNAGSYTVAVTDANRCVTTSNAKTVIVNALPIATISNNTPTTFCQGGNVVLNANVGNSLSYQWNQNGNVIAANANAAAFTTSTSGSYTVVVTDANACMSTSNAKIVIVNALPNSIINHVTPTTFCQGGNVALNTNATAGSTYQWRRNGESMNHEGRSYIATMSGNYSVIITDANNCTATSQPMSVVVNPIPTPILNAATNTQLCQGDSVQLQISGGSTYRWSNGATDTAIWVQNAGLYTVTVTNGSGCSAQMAQQITVKPLPIATLTATGATTFCQNGNVTLNGNTGLGLSYRWKKDGIGMLSETNPSYTAATTGNYTLVVTGSNGCQNASSPINVVVNPLPIPVLTASATAFCQGDSAQLRIRGGASYVWSNNRTDTAFWTKTAGTYAVTVTSDLGCTAIASKSLIMNALPNAIITSNGSTTFCQGSNVSLVAQAGAGWTYQWSQNSNRIVGATNRTYGTGNAGAFTVQVTDTNSCKNTSAVTNVIVNSKPTVNFTNRIQTGTGSMVDFTNTSSAGTVQWHFGDSLNTTSTQWNPTFWYKKNGSYNVRLVVTNADGCTDSTSANVMITGVRTDVNDLVKPLKINVFPNPFSEWMTIEIENGSLSLGNNDKIMVTNALGQMVHQAILNQKTISLDTQTWVEGIYHIALVSNGQPITVQKIVKVLR